MTTLTKALTPFRTKAVNQSERTFEGMASTWETDLGRDQIMQGAYKRTLDHWRQSGRSLPLIDQHDYSSVTRTRLGKMIDARETDEGLWTQFKVFETSAGNDFMAILSDSGIDGLSIGYEPVPSQTEHKDGIRILREVKLFEISAVHWGMNPGALIDTASVKSLLEAARAGTLTDDEKTELRALLADAPAPEPAATDDALAPEAQAELKSMLLRLKLRSLVTRAA